jgi:hypothetical protein
MIGELKAETAKWELTKRQALKRGDLAKEVRDYEHKVDDYLCNLDDARLWPIPPEDHDYPDRPGKAFRHDSLQPDDSPSVDTHWEMVQDPQAPPGHLQEETFATAETELGHEFPCCEPCNFYPTKVAWERQMIEHNRTERHLLLTGQLVTETQGGLETATDSGYASLSQGPAKGPLQPVVENLTDIEEQDDAGGEACASDCGIDHAPTVYSAASYLDGDHLDAYKLELADILVNRLRALDLTPETKKRMACVLPDLLKGFALRLGQHSTTKSENEVMYFVHKYRQ